MSIAQIKLNKIYDRFTIGEIRNPVTLKSIQDKTTQILFVSVFCCDCEGQILPGKPREKADNGELLCLACTKRAEALAVADWETKEDAFIN